MAARKKATKKKAAKAGSSKPAYDFCVKALSEDQKVAFATVRDAAAKKGLVLYPIVYGRAKAALGLVKVAKYGQGKAAQKKRTATKAVATRSVTRKPGRRGPGRPKGSKNKPRMSAGGDLAGALQEVVQMQRDHEKLKSVLTKVRELVDSVV